MTEDTTTSTPEPKARRRRTWSAFGDIRRVPSEYEVVTHETNYTVRKGRRAAMEANPSSPGNMWFLTYRDRSPLQAEDWSNFRDPDKLIYRHYVTRQDEQETVVAGILDEYSDAGHDKTLTPQWRAALQALFTPMRYSAHAAQMCQAYIGQMAPTSYITNAASFAAADMLRRNSLISYRTRELAQSWPDDGFGTAERAAWENGPQWQPARKALELGLVAYDWAEAFTALNLVVLPTIDDVLTRQLGEIARQNGDELTWLLLGNLNLDVQRRARWSVALAKYALGARPENAAVFAKWIQRWEPRADAAAAGLGSAFEPVGRASSEVEAQARAARRSLLADAGLEASAGVPG